MQALTITALVLATVSGAARAESCQPAAPLVLNQATAAQLNDLYSKYSATVASQKKMNEFLKNFKDHSFGSGDAQIAIGDGSGCSPDFCHAYVSVDPQYLQQVLDDALTRRITDIRCSIMKLGATLP